jgi:hypothetical protein
MSLGSHAHPPRIFLTNKMSSEVAEQRPRPSSVGSCLIGCRAFRIDESQDCDFVRRETHAQERMSECIMTLGSVVEGISREFKAESSD